MSFKHFKHLNVPEHWEHYWSKYPQGYTILEALISWVSQVDSMVDDYNQLTNHVDNFKESVNSTTDGFREELDDFLSQFDDNLSTEVINTLSDWQESGFLNHVIDEALQNQIDDVSEQLTQNVTSYISDATVGNGVPENKAYSISYLREKQSYLLSRFYQLFKQRIDHTITCQGNSMVYGHDTVSSDIRPVDTATLPDGSTHMQTRASVTYPEALQDYLIEINNKTTVINRGYSGDNAQTGYNRWITPSGSNLTLLMYGINDANSNGTAYKGDINQFKNWYIKLISREVLRDSAVVILLPTKSKNTNILTEEITAVLYEIGEMFGCPVIDAALMTSNYSASAIYSDDTHFNGTGYRLLGAKIASLFVGSGVIEPLKVYSGTKLLTRPVLDNCYAFAGASYEGSSAIDTPDEVNGAGVAIKLNATNQRVYYSFYAEEDDLVVIPSLYFGGGESSTVKVSLDFDLLKPLNSFGRLVSGVNEKTTKGVVTAFNASGSGELFDRKTLKSSSDERYLKIVRKGWHTISITMTNTNGGYCYVKGLEFISNENFKKNFQTGAYTFTCENGKETLSSTINIYDLCEALGVDPLSDSFWKSLPCTLSVHNFSQTIRTYAFNLSDIRSSDNWFLSKNSDVYNLIDTPTDERTLSNLVFNPTTKVLTLNWGGNKTRGASVAIKIA